ncbi:MAG: hypothetical protein MO852_04085, partial [Candidatus Devosia euplotis]|nr:hypothetical protein [Candidatus Devosia euplotis]
LLAIISISAILAPFIAPGNPLKVSLADRFILPDAEYFFGIDNLGCDIFSMVMHGGRTSLLVGLIVTLVSMSVAVVLGAISGFYRQVDVVLMRFVDGLMAFPGIVSGHSSGRHYGAIDENGHRLPLDRPGCAIASGGPWTGSGGA